VILLLLSSSSSSLSSLKQKRYNVHADTGGNTSGEECHAERNRKGRKYVKRFIYGGITNMEHEMCADTGSSYGSLKSKERLKGKFGRQNGKVLQSET